MLSSYLSDALKLLKLVNIVFADYIEKR